MHVVAGVDDPYEHDSLAAASPHVSGFLFASHPADCYYCEHVGVWLPVDVKADVDPPICHSLCDASSCHFYIWYRDAFPVSDSLLGCLSNKRVILLHAFVLSLPSDLDYKTSDISPL